MTKSNEIEDKVHETLEEVQQQAIASLNKWLIGDPKTLQENWDHIKALHKNIYFIVDHADRVALATVVRMLLDRLMEYGQPHERKYNIPDGPTITLFTVLFHCSLDDMRYMLRMLASSAVQGHQQIKKDEHKNIAKTRIDMLTKRVNRDIDEGRL